MEELKTLGFYGNSLLTWTIAISAFLLSRLVLQFFKKQLEKRTIRLGVEAEGVRQLPRLVLGQTKGFFLTVLSLYIASLPLTLPIKAQQLFGRVAIVVLLVQVAIWCSTMIDQWIDRQVRLRDPEETSVATTAGLIRFVAKTGLYVILVLLALNNMGVNITALVAGLGVGGIAIALAVQNILGDLFASLTIILDKPFVVGDTIAVGDSIGAIEHIGLKTTRLRSISGEQLIFSNNDLLQSRIRNFKRMQERRVLFIVGVTYSTPLEQLKRIPLLIRKAIEQQQNVRFDRCNLMALADSSLNFETVYWVMSPDFSVYSQIHEQINLTIIEQFNREQIDFAFPSRTLYVQSPRQSTDSASPQVLGIS